MSTLATIKPQRRGACPGLSAPMATGDGLLVRLLPRGTISLAAFAALCRAAQVHGNGVIEVTSRGSIQMRGLSEASAPQFAGAIAALDFAAEDGVPILSDPLAGLDAEAIFDSMPLADDLRRKIAQEPLVARLSPKVSVVIDGGGAIGLDAVAADIRLCAKRADGHVEFEVGIGGNAARDFEIGQINPMHGVEAAMALLHVIAQRGGGMRARDIVADEGAAVFRSAIEPFLSPRMRESTIERSTTPPIGAFALRDGTMALGIGLAFGHADAVMLERLAETANVGGAIGFRTAPGRALLAIGLAAKDAATFTACADRLGFITRADDPRRKVIACAGAPICASAHLASRALAPAIAADAARFDGTIHVSGCAKGCAHAAAATLTAVGTAGGCALIANGSAQDAPFAVVAERELRAAITNYVREHVEEPAHV
jgi:precorrin-3B synthase